MPAVSVESLRLELELCQRELDECRKSMEQMDGLFAHVAVAIFVPESCEMAQRRK